MSDSNPVCRLLPYAVADGAMNMAADEVILESAASGTASLRFYGWTEATVSLGYFQPESVHREDPMLASLPYIRRPSGGGTLVHHHEVTYALALPAGRPWQSGESWLCRMHRIIAAALSDLGVSTQFCAPASEQQSKPVLCFQHLTPGDLLIGNKKIAGSAQRRQRGALLQHGSILLAQSPFTPRLPGVLELSGRHLSIEEMHTELQNQFRLQTEWELIFTDWTNQQEERNSQLGEAKYGADAWNRKR